MTSRGTDAEDTWHRVLADWAVPTWATRLCTRIRLHAEDGNALILMPAAVLVALGLMSFSVDVALQWRAAFEAQSVAASLANDAASAVAPNEFYDGDAPAPAQHRVDQVITARQAISGSDSLGLACNATAVTTVTPPHVNVTCTYSFDPLLRPGGASTHQVSATADLEQG